MKGCRWCRLLFGVGLLAFLCGARAQETDDFLFLSNQELNVNDLSQMENAAEYYAHLREQPLCLNECDAEDLRQLGILNAWQIESLLHYRQSYGAI
ncbi:MAG: hypothetical protein K2I83_03690, partial [Bacteroidales bacterium]|nr:hypothetical protein [Bacteroidales bacterium]